MNTTRLMGDNSDKMNQNGIIVVCYMRTISPSFRGSAAGIGASTSEAK